ncbi:MAG: zinc metallopeptidase [Planctomycetota bacterium]|nr:MAG: zinc metallopeptidase [Planctomycetota bacterium]
MFWLDPYFPVYLMVIAPGVLLGIYASIKVKSTFARASKMPTQRNWAGKQVAQEILNAEGISDVSIEPTQGYLGDHYDPRHKVLRLSPDVYNGRSIAAAGVAAHEVGHAIQHARGYAPLSLRNTIVPVAVFGSNFSWIMIIAGLGMGFMKLALIGIALFTMVVLFQIINLPVEFNASRRARQALVAHGLTTQVEDREIGKVLNAAAMTYVAATITAILTLIYYLWRSGLIGGRR